MFGLDAIIAVGSLLIPPVVDFVKKKFLKPGQDTPEATMSTLATTKPDVLAPYVTAITGYLEAQVKYFNRDVTGTPSQWVIDVRAAIRPLATIGAGVTLVVLVMLSLSKREINPVLLPTIEGVRYTCETIVASWFGDRLSKS